MSDVSIQLSVDMKGAAADIKKFGDQVKTSFDSVARASSLMQKGFVGIAAGFTASSIISTLQGFVENASQAQKVVKGMEQALKLSGEYSQEASDGFREFADQIERTTGFTGGAILSQVALAKQFRVSNNEAKALINAAVDLAAYTGMDLPAAVSALGQTLDGTAGKIGNLVPEIQGLTKEQLLAGKAVELVAQRFRGTASTAVDSFSGYLNQARNDVNRMTTDLGVMVLASDSVKGMAREFARLTRSIADSESGRKAMLAFASALAAATLAAGIAATALALKAAAAAAAAAGITIGALLGPIGVVALAVGGLTAAIIGLKSEASATELVSNSQYQAAAERLAALESTANRLRASLSQARDEFFRSGASGKMDQIGAEIIQVEKEIAAQRAQIDESRMRQGREAEERYQREAAEAARQRQQRMTEEARRAAAERVKQEAKLYDKEAARQIKKFREMGASREEIAVNTFNTDFSNLEKLLAKRKITESEFYEFKRRLEEKFQEDLRKLEAQRVQKIGQNPFQAAAEGDFGFVSAGSGAMAAGAYGTTALLQGEAGAAKLIQDGAGALAEQFLGPGMGQLVGPIVGMLSQGPEKVKEMVLEFGKALPELIKNIALAIPALIEALPEVVAAFIEKLPEIVEAFIMMGPRLIAGLFKGIGNIMSDGFKQGLEDFTNGMLDIPRKIINALADGLRGLFENLNPFKGQEKAGAKGIGAALGGTLGFAVAGPVGAVVGGAAGAVLGGLLGFADGGVVPPGHATDTFPALVRSGERVLSPRQNENFEGLAGLADRLARHLGGEQQGDGPAGGGGRQLLPVVIQIGERELARVLVDLQQQGFRLA